MPRGFYGKTGVEFSNTLLQGTDELKARLRKRIETALLVGAEIVRERAYELANVSPGEVGNARDGRHMRDCIDIELRDDGTSITTKIGIDMSNVPYAAHQEFGARGKPFLRPAIDESRSEIRDLMQGVLDGTVAEDASVMVRFRRFA